MGFSGGGSNILKAHTHNGLTVQDGGALDFDDITQSQSSAGMVFFSDGTHLQQLAYPGVPAGETLTAVAASTSPTWGAAGGSLYELVGTTTTLVTAPNGYNGLHLTFTAIDMTAVTELIVLISATMGTNSQGILWNSRTSGYDYGGASTTTAQVGTDFGGSNLALIELGHYQVGTYRVGTFHLSLNEQNNHIYGWGQMGGEGGGNWAGGGNRNSDTTIDSVSFISDGQNMPAGNHRLTVYKVSR